MVKELKEQITARLEERRRELGMPTSALAARAGLSRQTVIRMLQDDASDFTFSNLLLVAESLGVRLQLNEVPAEEFKEQVAIKKAERAIRLTQGNVALESQAIDEQAIKLRLYDTKNRIACSNRKLWAQ